MNTLYHPTPLRASVQTARNFYLRCNAMPLYGHCRGVLKTACDVGIVEGRVILDPRADPKRQRANSTLAETILYHTVERGSLGAGGTPLPAPLRDEEVLRELDVYCRLTRLERSGAPLTEFIPLLNNGRAPLALLAKIADYAVTHNEAEALQYLVGSWTGPFRTYSSMDEIRDLLRMDAIAGERIYAPVAELFGYQELAGDILRHSYGVNHPEIYALVMDTLASEEVRARLAATQSIARKLARSIRDTLRSFDYEAEVAIRMQKHAGKLMRKVRRRLRGDAENGVPALFAMDVEKISDWVALRVVVRRHEKREIDALAEDRKWRVIEGAVGIIDMCLQTMQLLRGGYSFSHAFKDKTNGYRAHHWDMRAEKPDNPSGSLPLPFEIQLKTSEWHEVAERGKAAHYYYIGGESEFVDMIADAYREILHKYDPTPAEQPGQARPG
ncbi:MAG: hypothetical protein AB1324_03115 [Candidatus Micrarchaeota archaeon]